jgi:SAM-dependent methyltransferase
VLKKTTDEACVVCGKARLQPTGFSRDLGELIEQWEAHVGERFPEQTRSAYQSVGNIELFRCANCSTETFLPMVAGSDEFYAHITQNEYYISDKWEFDFAINEIVRDGARTVFDYGCGSGNFLRRLMKGRDIRGIGYDPGAADSGTADDAGFLRVKTLDLAALDGTQVDALCMFQVLEHVADPFATLTEALTLLKTGGLLIVAVPDNSGPIRHYPDALTNLPPHHVTRWRKASMIALSERAGLKNAAIHFEWLPDYLWRMYLPVMVTKGALPMLGRACNRLGLTTGLLNTLEWLGFKTLPFVPGHTMLMVCRKP